jgi:hypothetical protein
MNFMTAGAVSTTQLQISDILSTHAETRTASDRTFMFQGSPIRKKHVCA